MDTVIVPVLSKSRFDYSFLGTGASETVELVRALNIAPFYRVQLIVRIHSLTLDLTNPGSFTFDLVNTLPSEEDSREFSADPSAASFIAVTINSASPAAPVIVSGTASDPGAFLKLSLTANQSGAAAGVNLYGEFSAVVLGRRQ